MTGADLITAERMRQIEQEGYTPEHDDHHQNGALAVIAASLAVDGTDAQVFDPLERGTPGMISCDDPDTPLGGDPWRLIRKHGYRGNTPDRIRILSIAGALIAAEIDRKLRQSARS